MVPVPSIPGAVAMPNDAKLGFVLGVALVIAVAVLFFRRDVPVSAQPRAVSVAPAELGRPPHRGRPLPVTPATLAPSEEPGETNP
jgi:hypothetical protein